MKVFLLFIRIKLLIHYILLQLKYRDAELYLMRFRQCMTRGMTVVKMYLVTTIKSLGYDIYKQISAMVKGEQPNFLLLKKRIGG